jgi:hypothetical protein
MNEYTRNPQQPGQYGKPPYGGEPTPPPPPPPCPDPCGSKPPWGPPAIRPECCPDQDDCCGDGESYDGCSWYEVDDPCVRAASADCGGAWTKITCTCESSNKDCPCGDKWDCGGYPRPTCVPCDPCAPDDPPPDGGEPPPPSCDADGLRRQLTAERLEIQARLNDKAQADARIKAAQDREKELTALIGVFDKIVDTYKGQRQNLICREDCLKGFYRDVTKVFQDKQRFPDACLTEMQGLINKELCKLEKARCCQKMLEGQLSTLTRLIWTQQQADRSLKQADVAFAALKDLPKWIGDRFTELDALKKAINDALNDKDPQKQQIAFYLFYWQFVPGLCKRFPDVVCCCKPKTGDEASRSTATTAAAATPPAPPAPGIGCKPGDWHPSVVTVDILRQLICCASDHVKAEKDALQKATAAVDKARQDLDFITKTVADEAKGLDDRIKTALEKFTCGTAASSS